MLKRSKDQEKKGSEKREVLLVSFWKIARFVFAIICSWQFSSRGSETQLARIGNPLYSDCRSPRSL